MPLMVHMLPKFSLSGIIRLKMNPVKEVKMIGDDYFIHTGSPHFIRFVKDIKNYPVFEEGRKIRYEDLSNRAERM